MADGGEYGGQSLGLGGLLDNTLSAGGEGRVSGWFMVSAGELSKIRRGGRRMHGQQSDFVVIGSC